MGKVYKSVEELIGRTPLLEVVNLEREKGLKARVLVKLESYNPAGSVKDRAALFMIRDAEERGLIRPGIRSLSQPAETQGSGLPLWRHPGAIG